MVKPDNWFESGTFFDIRKKQMQKQSQLGMKGTAKNLDTHTGKAHLFLLGRKKKCVWKSTHRFFLLGQGWQKGFKSQSSGHRGAAAWSFVLISLGPSLGTGRTLRWWWPNISSALPSSDVTQPAGSQVQCSFRLR